MWRWFSERNCEVCGKTIYIPDTNQWTYKRDGTKRARKSIVYFCSYKCMRQYDKEKEM